jgi:sigma-B regulation protein RsbU (phosphoserine phosphatase)
LNPSNHDEPKKAVQILIVDDEPDLELLVRQRFRKQIREQEYEFIFAHNGVEALTMLQRDAEIELVLTDINMPVMDGLTLLRELVEARPQLQPVVVSAYGDMVNLRTAMNRGAFDFVTKPIDFQDFETTMTKALEHGRLIKRATQDRDELAALARELAVAAEIQRAILPVNFAPFPGRTNLDLRVMTLPGQRVSPTPTTVKSVVCVSTPISRKWRLTDSHAPRAVMPIFLWS